MSSTIIIYVHSYLTAYLSWFYIKNNKIKDKQIIVLYDRIRKESIQFLPGKKIELCEEFGDRFVSIKQFWNKWIKVNQFIKKNAVREFDLIVPHLFFGILQIFASNNKCKKLIYVEEGDLSYLSEIQLQERFNYSIDNYMRKLFSLGYLYDKHPFPKNIKEKEFICFHSSAFQFNNFTKKIVDFSLVFSIPIPDKKFDNSIIFLLDNLSSYKEYSLSDYYFEIRKAFEFIKNQLGNKIFLKSHPSLSFFKVDSNEIINIIKHIGLDYEFIDESIEKIVANNKNVIIITFISSLIRYCSYANVRPYFWGKSLIKEGSTWSKFLDQFSEKVIFIDD